MNHEVLTPIKRQIIQTVTGGADYCDSPYRDAVKEYTPNDDDTDVQFELVWRVKRAGRLMGDPKIVALADTEIDRMVRLRRTMTSIHKINGLYLKEPAQVQFVSGLVETARLVEMELLDYQIVNLVVKKCPYQQLEQPPYSNFTPSRRSDIISQRDQDELRFLRPQEFDWASQEAFEQNLQRTTSTDQSTYDYLDSTREDYRYTGHQN